MNELMNYWSELSVVWQCGLAMLALIGFATIWTGWNAPTYRR